LIRWRGAVKQAIRGKRGQAMLRELAQALDALPEKRLAVGSLVTADGEFCTLGALGRARGMDMAPIDPENRDEVAKAFGVSGALAAEIMWLNDDMDDEYGGYAEVEVCGPMRGWERHRQSVRLYRENAAEVRWSRMRAWAAAQLQEPTKGST
jgi:hypothetical protein